jgi:hypothetical protein
VQDATKYQPNGNNGVLRSVLYDSWDFRCYSCNRPKDFTDTQIDHLIPQKLPDGRQLAAILTELGLPADFDINDPANLALICGACNQEKKNQDFTVAPVFLARLRKAERLRPKVIKAVQDFALSGDVAKALLFAAEAPLPDQAAKASFVENASSVVQRLVLLDESRLQYTAFREIRLDLGDGLSLDVGLALDAPARRAVATLEDVYEADVEDLLQEPLLNIYNKLHVDVESAFEALEGPAGPVNSGPPVSDHMRIDVDSISFTRTPPGMSFEFEGEFEGAMSASLVRSSDDGNDLVDFQGDAVVSGRFSFEVTGDPSDNSLEVGEPWADDLQIDVSTSR